MRRNYLTLGEALASHRLDAFVRQEEARGVELVYGSELERALALLIKTPIRGSKLSPSRIGPERIHDFTVS